MKDSQAYLSICAIYRNEARYMPEWIEFHRLLGVERFYLFNNRSTDDHLEVLRPYMDDGSVVWRDWPMFPGQLKAFDTCIEEHRHDSRWIAFIDLDEFLFSPTGRLLPDVMSDFEGCAGIAVNMINYGTSGHETPPAGLAIENYTRRIRLDGPRNTLIKSIVNPERTRRVGRTPHYFFYTDRQKAVDENFQMARGHATEKVSAALLRINHYFTRSQQERNQKIARRGAGMGLLIRNPETVAERDRRLNEELDEILVPYGRAVRAALAARDTGKPLPPGALETALAG